MEAVYYAVRANLRRLLNLHPQWTHSHYAQAVGMSRGWVKKWKRRLQEAEPEDEQVQGERLPRSSRTIYCILQQAGRIAHRLPQVLRLDRDVRFVGSPSGSDFPSALVRFCECLGVGVLLCDPHQPQQNELVAYCTPSA